MSAVPPATDNSKSLKIKVGLLSVNVTIIYSGKGGEHLLFTAYSNSENQQKWL